MQGRSAVVSSTSRRCPKSHRSGFWECARKVFEVLIGEPPGTLPRLDIVTRRAILQLARLHSNVTQSIDLERAGALGRPIAS